MIWSSGALFPLIPFALLNLKEFLCYLHEIKVGICGSMVVSPNKSDCFWSCHHFHRNGWYIILYSLNIKGKIDANDSLCGLWLFHLKKYSRFYGANQLFSACDILPLTRKQFQKNFLSLSDFNYASMNRDELCSGVNRLFRIYQPLWAVQYTATPDFSSF